MPWWIVLCAKLILSRLPFGYRLWRRLGLFRHGRMDQAAYVLEVFNSHCKRVGLVGDLKGRVVLELGPGDSIATALVAASHGAHGVLVDTGSYASRDIRTYRSIALKLRAYGLNPPDISDSPTFDDILRRCGATYFTEGLSSLKTIGDGSVDFIFSQAVLEHIREGEFSQTMLECRRVLKKGGQASHRIDFKDHMGGGLNSLRFGKDVWESKIFSTSGFYTNRIRFSRMLDLIREAGFFIEECDLMRWDVIPISKLALSSEFADLSDDDLLIRECNLTLR